MTKGITFIMAMAILALLWLYPFDDVALLRTVAIVGWGQFAAYLAWRIVMEHFVIDDDLVEKGDE